MNAQPSQSRQSGMVLITVLLIVALIALIAYQLLYKQTLSHQRSSLIIHQAQIQAVESGLIDWVKTGLKMDGQHTDIDHLQQTWAQPMLPVTFAGGELAGRLWDAQARINVNNIGLSQNDSERFLWQALWQRVSQSHELPQNLGPLLADWVDADREPTTQGAESDQYLLATPPRRAADRPMVLAQEMTQLIDMNWQAFQRIAPWMIALPEATAVNVNTAEVPVLIWLAEVISEDVARNWADWRQQSPAENNQAFRQFVAEATGRNLDTIEKQLPDQLITVRSRFFLMQGEARYGDMNTTLWALFQRSRGQGQESVTVLQTWHSALAQ